MKRLLLISAILLLACASASASGKESGEGGFDMQEYLFGHVLDSYQWHVTSWKGHELSIPLPIIVFGQDGPRIFLSDKLEEGKTYDGFFIPEDGPNKGKVVELDGNGNQVRPIDISITKNVLSLMISGALLVWLVLACSRWYRRHDVLKEAPTGVAALLEPVINMINEDVIKDSVGPGYERFSPYLLTAFFFILINNLMGIIPIFPGGANVTGNIAVTLCMAVFTFISVNLFGNRHYFKEIFWPDVPMFLKAIPIMPVIEIVGMFTKPISLMIRLFANIFAGHVLILSVVALIFITAAMGPVLNGSMTLISVLFGIFMDCLELLVAFIQAYVFTMLSSVYIGMAHPRENS